MSDYLPIDILAEIFVRLPVESLVRFTSVCKTWFSLIKSPYFITKHLNHSKRNTEHLLLTAFRIEFRQRYLLGCSGDKFGNGFFELKSPFRRPFGRKKMVGSCNGLLCMADDSPCILVWNPLIMKSVTLPLPSIPHTFLRNRVFGFGAHPTTHEYMLVSIAYGNLDEEQGRFPSKVELYTQGTGSWRCITSVGHPHHVPNCHSFQTFVNGAIHWIAFERTAVDGFRSLIMLFNTGSQAFSVMMMPTALVNHNSARLSITLYGESLALLCRGKLGEGSCCLWVMKEYGVAESWAKLYNFNLPEVLKIIGFRKNGEVLLSTIDNGQLLCYNYETRTLTNTGYHECFDLFAADTFTESLVLLEGGNGSSRGSRRLSRVNRSVKRGRGST